MEEWHIPRESTSECTTDCNHGPLSNGVPGNEASMSTQLHTNNKYKLNETEKVERGERRGERKTEEERGGEMEMREERGGRGGERMRLRWRERGAERKEEAESREGEERGRGRAREVQKRISKEGKNTLDCHIYTVRHRLHSHLHWSGIQDQQGFTHLSY